MTRPFLLTQTGMLALFAVCGLAAPAIAQDALGNGRGLEKSTSRYPQTQQPKGGRDFAAEVKFRNAIVTGNAPNGLSFRGNAGYSDAGDFRGKLGSDDLYSYRRDSYFSGLSGQGIRGTDALQYQFALTTGSSAPSGLAGSLDLSRSGARFGQPRAISRDRVAEDRERSGSGSWLRSPSAFEADRALQPTSLGLRRTKEGGQEFITASSLLGVRSRSTGEPTAAQRREAKPVVDRGNAADPTGTRSFGRREGDDSPSGARRAPEAPATPEGSKPAKTPASNAYEALIDRLDEWESKSATGNRALTEGDPLEIRINRLRRHLIGDRKYTPPPTLPTDSPEFPTSPVDPEDVAIDPGMERLDPDTVRMVREASGKAQEYAKPAPDGAAASGMYTRDLLAAQKLLGERRYFDAEARFSRALIVRPNDPVALAGRLHSQLGSGMYLSATVNLRQLLFGTPEFAGVRFAPEMLPPRERLEQIVSRLRERISATDDSDGIPRSIAGRDAGLVIAYIGYQTASTPLISEGLAAAERPMETGAPVDEISTRLHSYLRAVWLGETPAAKELPAAPDK